MLLLEAAIADRACMALAVDQASDHPKSEELPGLIADGVRHAGK